MEPFDFEGQQVVPRLTAHRGDDDLLTAGWGLAGLQASLPALADDAVIDAASLRRRALHSNWNGIAQLRPPAAELAVALARPVPGRELMALLRLPGARQPQRVLLQVPDDFDPQRPRLLLCAASGSRGVYGGIALAGGWGLPRGWAVAYTDKACGTDWYDVDSGEAPGLDGLPTTGPARQAFAPQAGGLPAHSVLIRHAHSTDNPEARWGDCVSQAGRFAWAALNQLFPRERPAASARRRTLAVGLSNGGAAVLRALEHDQAIDAAVVLAPNVLPRRGGRAFLEYAGEAALWMPLALTTPGFIEALPAAEALGGMPLAAMAERCAAALQTLHGRRPTPREALRHLRRRGWPRHTLQAAPLSCLFEFWYSALATYSIALGRHAPGEHPLGCRFAAVDAGGQPRASTPRERALWWSDGAGIVPGAGVAIVDPGPRVEQLVKWGRIGTGHPERARLARGIAALRCAPPRPGLPVTLVHGLADGLIPPAFSSEPWQRAAAAAGAELTVWRPPNAPHFDAFLGIPGYGERLEPLLPYGYRGLDQQARRIGAD